MTIEKIPYKYTLVAYHERLETLNHMATGNHHSYDFSIILNEKVGTIGNSLSCKGNFAKIPTLGQQISVSINSNGQCSLIGVGIVK